MNTQFARDLNFVLSLYWTRQSQVLETSVARGQCRVKYHQLSRFHKILSAKTQIHRITPVPYKIHAVVKYHPIIKILAPLIEVSAPLKQHEMAPQHSHRFHPYHRSQCSNSLSAATGRFLPAIPSSRSSTALHTVSAYSNS